MRIIQSDRFIFHRFVTDAIGLVLASYTGFGVNWMIDNVSHTPSKFSHVPALALAACFVVADYLIAKRRGNKRWLGLDTLALASFCGYAMFAILMLIYYLVMEGSTEFGVAILGWLLLSFIFLIPALIIPLIIRLMAWPIVEHFRQER